MIIRLEPFDIFLADQQNVGFKHYYDLMRTLMMSLPLSITTTVDQQNMI